MQLFGKIGRGIACECVGACPDGAPNGTCVTAPGGYCFAAVETVLDDAGRPARDRAAGCLPPDESGLMQCKGGLSPHRIPKMIECCYDSDFCNRRLQPVLPEPPPEEAASSAAGGALLLGCALGVALLAGVLALALLGRRRRAKRPPSPPAPPPDASSGSGSGLPLLVQRTVAKQIQMVRSVGAGRYGEVWLARWRGEKVAVKVFFTTEEASWFRETEIYQTVLLRHDNILGFIAADIKGTGSWTQMLLITDYHERGSLYDYLQAHALSTHEVFAMAHSVAAGLAHLHMDIFGTKGKPAIAHRDIKSKNILVKRDGTCALADFGLAVRYVAERDEVELAPSARVGTRRYMAPEILSDALDTDNFDAFRMADVYALALVLWELARRWRPAGLPAALPYHDLVPPDPSVEHMARVVVTSRARPPLPTAPALAPLAALMAQCWPHEPAQRLTALRVKKSLARCLRPAPPVPLAPLPPHLPADLDDKLPPAPAPPPALAPLLPADKHS